MTESSTQRFTDMVAFVTGAGSGIGRTTALAFAAEGAAVAVAGIPKATSARPPADRAGRRPRPALTCGVTSDSDVQAALARTIETFGRLDLAFNTPECRSTVGAPRDL